MKHSKYLLVGMTIRKHYNSPQFPRTPLKRLLTEQELALLVLYFPQHSIWKYVDANDRILLGGEVGQPCTYYVELADLPKLTTVKPRRVKMLSNNSKSNQLFSNCGVEPTFYPIIKLHPALSAKNSTLWDDLVEIVVSQWDSSSFLSNAHPWCQDMIEDEGVLEVRGTHEYTTLPTITKDFDKLRKLLKTNGFNPSSIEDRNVEGGCHVNFNLEDKYVRYNETRNGLVERFCVNVIGFLNKYPSIVWGYLAPEDNESSCVITKNYEKINLDCTEKGDMLTIRCDTKYTNEKIIKYINYMELRFFMMPRTTAEFAFHIKTGSNLLKYIWNKTIKSPNKILYPIINDKDKLQAYTFARANKELKTILPTIGIDYNEFVSFGKVKMLRERFSFGKNYIL